MTEAIFAGFGLLIGLIGFGGMIAAAWILSSDEGDVE